MSKAIVIAIIATFASACGPRVVDEDRPPGELVYEDSFLRLYRLDRRIEVIYDYEREDGLEGECGILTDRAYEELETTIESLDPSKDYVVDQEECEVIDGVYIDGFEHSPFACYWLCCHSDLLPIATVYLAVLETFSNGDPPTINGESYVALEPDHPCP
jgi:hypothetical protein